MDDLMSEGMVTAVHPQTRQTLALQSELSFFNHRSNSRRVHAKGLNHHRFVIDHLQEMHLSRRT